VITHPVDERFGDCVDNPPTPGAHPNRGVKVKHEDDDLQIAGGPCEQKLAAGSWDEMVKTMTKHVMEKHPDTAKAMEKMHNEDP
jgi:hypothetical protein